MKILYHHRTLGDGAEGIHVSEIVKSFRELGHEVEVVSLIGESTNVKSSAQGRWSNIKKSLPGFTFELAELGYNIPGYVGLSRVVKRFRPDFIYDRYVSYNYSAVGVGCWYKIPVIVEVNSPYSYQKQTYDEKLYFKSLIAYCEKKICCDATRVIVVSTPLKKILVSLGVPETQIVVMANGVDHKVFRPDINGQEVRQQYGINEKIVIGFSGILRPWHGLDMLLNAFAEVLTDNKNIHLLIVGDGPIRSQLEDIIFQKGLSVHVTITGRQPHEKMRLFVAAMDVAVSPRATAYASPMKILEYMAMGKAVVAPDMANIRDIVSAPDDALLFRQEDPEDMAKVLMTVINDEPLRVRIGEAARKKIEMERTWMHNAERVITLVESHRGNS